LLTIGQLARYTGVSTKTIRFYHAKGVLAEPARDGSGYRRYTAADAIALIKLRALAEAGVPLRRIPALLAAPAEEIRRTLGLIDRELTVKIRALRKTQQRLRDVASGGETLLPPGVAEYLGQLREIGLSDRWVRLECDLWILVFATHPEVAGQLLRDQSQAKTEPEVAQIYRDYDRAHDLDPKDPQLDLLAKRIAEATRRRYADTQPPAPNAESPIPGLIQGEVNASSPAWQRLDALIRAQLATWTG